MLQGKDSDELAIVSKLECGVKFYQTSSPDVAKFFHIPAVKRPVLVLLNNEEENTLYGMCLDLEFRIFLHFWHLCAAGFVCNAMGIMQMGSSVHLPLPIFCMRTSFLLLTRLQHTGNCPLYLLHC